MKRNLVACFAGDIQFRSFGRYLADSNSRAGMEQIANGFVFEEDKKKALNILYTVRFLALLFLTDLVLESYSRPEFLFVRSQD